MLYDLLIAPFADFGFMKRALVASLCLSIGGSSIGVFLILRRMSLMGDALAHALLASGHFAEGWAEYEWRWKTRPMLRVTDELRAIPQARAAIPYAARNSELNSLSAAPRPGSARVRRTAKSTSRKRPAATKPCAVA